MKIQNVTFIGLGVMGYNMAGHLKKNNFNTTVYNRTFSVSEKWVNEFGGESKKLQERLPQMLTLCAYALDEMRI